MKKYEVKIGYTILMKISAIDEKEAEEIAWFEFDCIEPPVEPMIAIKEVK